MSELIKTLHKKGDASVEIYPNIKRDNIPTHAINNDKLDANAVGTNNINDLAVTTPKLMAECVTTPKLANACVTRDKLGYEAVGEDEIGEKQVKTYHLADESVTEDKLYPGCVSRDKISFALYRHYVCIEDSVEGKGSFIIDSNNYPNPVDDYAELTSLIGIGKKYIVNNRINGVINYVEVTANGITLGEEYYATGYQDESAVDYDNITDIHDVVVQLI